MTFTHRKLYAVEKVEIVWNFTPKMFHRFVSFFLPSLLSSSLLSSFLSLFLSTKLATNSMNPEFGSQKI